MKRVRLLSTMILAAGLLATAAAHAARPRAAIGPASGPFYLGAKAGLMMPDTGGFDDAINVGVYGGYNLLGEGTQIKANLGGGTMAIEGELTLTAVDGDFSAGGVNGDWQVSALGVLAAYRFPITDDFFVKGRAGFVRVDVDHSVAGVRGSGADTDIALGGGAGWKLGPGSLELEIMRFDAGDGFDFLSVGYLWNF